MREETLFEMPAAQAQPARPPTLPDEARVLRPRREQLQWAATDLESLLSQDHAARAVWGFLEKLDLSASTGLSRR